MFKHLTFLKKVIYSCKTEEQLQATKDWITKVIKFNEPDPNMWLIILLPVDRAYSEKLLELKPKL